MSKEMLEVAQIEPTFQQKGGHTVADEAQGERSGGGDLPEVRSEAALQTAHAQGLAVVSQPQGVPLIAATFLCEQSWAYLV